MSYELSIIVETVLRHGESVLAKIVQEYFFEPSKRVPQIEHCFAVLVYARVEK